MSKKVKVKFYSDPGHGWGAVKRRLLADLGVLDQISTYSYQKGETVYLEEDCDFPVFLRAIRQAGGDVEYIEKNTNRYSPIRNYYHFSKS